MIGDRHMPDAMHSASGFDRIEVVTGVERRRRWSLGEKLKAVEESAAPGMTVSYVARKYVFLRACYFVGESS
jgi:transposase